MNTGAFANCFSNLVLVEHILCPRSSDKPDTDCPKEFTTYRGRHLWVSDDRAVCLCLLDARARFDAGTTQAAPGGSDIKAKMKVREKFLRGESQG